MILEVQSMIDLDQLLQDSGKVFWMVLEGSL